MQQEIQGTYNSKPVVFSSLAFHLKFVVVAKSIPIKTNLPGSLCTQINMNAPELMVIILMNLNETVRLTQSILLLLLLLLTLCGLKGIK